jgi:hypothetical protein
LKEIYDTHSLNQKNCKDNTYHLQYQQKWELRINLEEKGRIKESGLQKDLSSKKVEKENLKEEERERYADEQDILPDKYKKQLELDSIAQIETKRRNLTFAKQAREEMNTENSTARNG